MEMNRTILILIIAAVFFSFSCKSELPPVQEESYSEMDNLSYYKPVPDTPVLASSSSLKFFHDEENKIRKRYLVQSNKFSYPADYGLASDNISLQELAFEQDGILLDYTPLADEIIIVTDGELKLVIDNSREYILAEDHAIALKAGLKRRLLNNAEKVSACYILSSPPFNPDKLDEKAVTLTDENIGSLISEVIKIEDGSFAENNQIQLQKIFYPEIFQAGITLGMITFPPDTGISDISIDSESIYYSSTGEIIIKEKNSSQNYIISRDKYLYVPGNTAIELYNSSNEIRNLIYFYPNK